MKELKASDKVTQKMTHDGAVSENLATGEQENISSREAEVDLTPAAEHIAYAHNRHKEHRNARKESDTIRSGHTARQQPSSRLQFTEEERSAPDLQAAIRRSDKAADRLDKAKAAIPTRKVLQAERIYDEAAGRGKTRLRFGEVEKLPNTRLRFDPLTRPVQEVTLAAHSKVHQAEQENVGVEAGHKGEELAEHTAVYAGSRIRSAVREHRMKPWQEAAKAEAASIRANADYLYQKALHDDPALAASNPVSRYLHKKRIQRDYAKKIRQTGNTAAAAGRTACRVKDTVKEVFTRIKPSRAVLLILGIGASAVLLFGGISSCSVMAGSGVSGIFATSYLSEDRDMLAAEAAYAGMEQALRYELDNYAVLHPGHDEYHFDLDDIGHDPYVLISILSAFHEGIFTFEQVEDRIENLFGQQYKITETITTETRYRTETEIGERHAQDPVTGRFLYDRYGQPVMEEYEYEVEVPYTYSICHVKMENFDLSHLPVYIMDEETLSMYATYMSTLGNREDLFAGTLGASTLKEPTYYEIPPSALEDETFAAMVTEAEKYLGYPYVWGGSNPSTSFDCSGFVSWVINHSGWNVGRTSAQGLYNLCTPVSSANAKPGDLVFFVGTYDTPGISHVGIYVGGGMMIHCGSPISYTTLNTTYWQSHYYSFGRLP